MGRETGVSGVCIDGNTIIVLNEEECRASGLLEV